MFAIGNSLREARNRRGLSPAEVQKGIRIRERYLTALEEERWELLPGDAYTKGFLRTYADFLGLDGNLYVEEYNARIAHHDADPLLVPESLAVSRRSRRSMLRMLFGVLVLGAVVAGLAALSTGTGMGGSAPTEALGKAPKGAVKGKLIAAALPAIRPAHKAHPAAKTTTPAKTTVITAARGRSWLAVRRGGPTGAILFQNVLERGKRLRFAVGHNLWVRMGRPWNVDITLGRRRVNGLPVRPGNVLLTQSGPRAA
jgi:cytoskeletal protein RodZ